MNKDVSRIFLFSEDLLEGADFGGSFACSRRYISKADTRLDLAVREMSVSSCSTSSMARVSRLRREAGGTRHLGPAGGFSTESSYFCLGETR